MAREIPEVVRAAAGLAATVLDEARKLPETLPGLPVRLIGLAMQQAMKVQQQYAGFVARGDELFTGLRGEDEPGLATFDDDEDEPLVAPAGFRGSAFDRADAEPTSADVDLIIDEEVAAAQEAPDTEAILDEIAIDELVDQAPTLEETAPTTPAPAKSAPAKAAKASAKAPKPAKATKPRKPAKAGARAEDAAVTEDAAAVEAALLEAALAAPGTDSPATDSPATAPSAADTVEAEPTADVATTVDVLTPAGDVTEVPATVTDEGVAAPEAAEPAPAVDSPAPASDTATAIDEGGTPVAAAPAAAGNNGSAGNGTAAASSAPANPPIDGYDTFTVAQLRGRLRGYALTTVEELIAYEQATRARAPYLTMLRNRLEKLEEQAIESSPLAPRGA
jgi:hypothetical protein